MISRKSKIFVAGHNGLVGSAIVRRLKEKGFKNILVESRKKLDLLNQEKVLHYLKKKKPKAIIIAAARVGGIFANNRFKAEFIYENLCIQNNVIHAAYLSKIKNLIFLGSSCVYPKNCKQPIKETYLLTSELEKTNEPYAVAKIAGIKMCESYNYQYKTNYKCLMPSNTYGPNDNYNLKTSHFFPALIKKVFDYKYKKIKKIVIWGTGNPKRELIYVDDIADACIFFLKKKTKETLINIGTGMDHKIQYYLNFIKKKLDVKAKVFFDTRKPDGVKRKLLDISLALSYGWKPKVSLNQGFDSTFKSFLKNC